MDFSRLSHAYTGSSRDRRVWDASMCVVAHGMELGKQLGRRDVEGIHVAPPAG